MNTYISPTLPTRLKHPMRLEGHNTLCTYVVSIIVHEDGDGEVTLNGYLCTDGNTYDDYDYLIQVYLEQEWIEYE